MQYLTGFTAWNPREARGLRPWASRGFQAVNPVSYCMGVTSYFNPIFMQSVTRIFEVSELKFMLNHMKIHNASVNGTLGSHMFFLTILHLRYEIICV